MDGKSKTVMITGASSGIGLDAGWIVLPGAGKGGVGLVGATPRFAGQASGRPCKAIPIGSTRQKWAAPAVFAMVPGLLFMRL
jgi:hypothetical protein